MTTYTWTDNAMQGGTACDVDKVNNNLMHLKYDNGGNLPVNALGTITGNFTLEANKVSTANITASVTLSLPTTGLVSGVENKCVFDFTTTSTSSPILPSGLKWSDKNRGVAPTSFSTLSGVRNRLTFITIDGGTNWEAEYATFGAVETAWTQPTLSANGTLGGSSFAVYALSPQSGYPCYQAFDNNSSTLFSGEGVPNYMIMYNPSALKVSSIVITHNGGYVLGGWTLYGSNDNSTYTALTSGSTMTTTYTLEIPTANRDFYKYYKLYWTSAPGDGSHINITQLNLNAVYITTN